MEGCTFEKCQNCQHVECLTGQIAREKGKEAYEEFLAGWDESIDVPKELDSDELTEEKIEKRKETLHELAESAGIPIVSIKTEVNVEQGDLIGNPVVQ